MADSEVQPARGAVLLAALTVVALCLRAPVTSPSPLLGTIVGGLGLPGAAAGVLTSLPVVCLGVFAFLAPRMGRAWGDRAAVVAGLGAVAAGGALRVAGSAAALFGGTVLLSAGIGVVNVLAAGVIKRRFPGRVAGVTAYFSGALTLGSAAGSALSVPLAGATGSPWRMPLLLAAVPVALLGVAAVWLTLPGGRNADPGAATGQGSVTPRRRLHRDRIALQVTLFFGMQAVLAYVVFGWLPDMWRWRGAGAAESGLALSVTSLVGVGGAALLPVVGRHLRDQRAQAVGAPVLMALGLAGTVLGPAGLLWPSAVVLGIGVGGGFALALSLIALRAPDPATAAALSGLAQGIGYLVGAAGPLGAGVLRSATGGWAVPLIALLAACAVQLAAGLDAGRDRPVAG